MWLHCKQRRRHEELISTRGGRAFDAFTDRRYTRATPLEERLHHDAKRGDEWRRLLGPRTRHEGTVWNVGIR